MSRAGLRGPALGALLALGALAGCARAHDGAAAHAPLTDAQRDSAIARSSLPGAPAVGAALRAAGQEAAHAAQVDTSAGH